MSVASVWGAELRAVRWGPPTGTLGAAAALTGLDLWLWSGGRAVVAWVVAALLGGTAALALDGTYDAGDATPVGRRPRLLVRLVGTLVAVAAWMGYAAQIGADDRVPLAPLAAVGAALVGLGAAATVALERRPVGEPGALVTGGLVTVVVGLTVLPVPSWASLAVAASEPARGAWTSAVVLALAVAAFLRGSADPWARRVSA